MSAAALLENLELRRLLSTTMVTDVTTTTATASFLDTALSPDSIADLTNHGLTTGSNWRFVNATFDETLMVDPFDTLGGTRVLTQVTVEGNIALLQDFNFRVINNNGTDITFSATGSAKENLVSDTLNLAASVAVDVPTTTVPGTPGSNDVTTQQHDLDGQGTSYTDANSPVPAITLNPGDAGFAAFLGNMPIDFHVTGSATTNIAFNGLGNEQVSGGYTTIGRGDVKVTYTFVVPQLCWVKHDGSGANLGGATFTVTRTKDENGVAVNDAPITVVDNSPPDKDPDAGEFLLDGIPLGTYEIKETAAPSGFLLDPDTETVVLSAANPDNTANCPVFVDVKPELCWLKQDGSGAPLGGATFLVTFPDNSTLSVTDNDSHDQDPDAGEFMLSLPSSPLTLGTYTIKETAAPAGYALDPTPQNVTLSEANPSNCDNTQGDVVPIFVNVIPELCWLKHDGSGALLGGATFSVTRTLDADGNPVNDAPISVVDNSPPDVDPDAGEFMLTGIPLGTYEIKETAAPAGYVLDPDTETVVLSFANPSNCDNTVGDVVPIFVDVKPELCWIKHDQFGALLGGATFEVTFPDNSKLTVLDNDAHDVDKTDGKFMLTIPSSPLTLGTYSIKETIAPAGFTLDPDTEMVTLTQANPSNCDNTPGDVVPVFVDTQEAGATATMGFWNNKNGQAVIKSSSTIGNDLATAYPNLFGSGAAPFNTLGANVRKPGTQVHFVDLTGRSSSDVAHAFQVFFNVTGPHAYAQLMANVLAAYFDANPTGTSTHFGFGGDLLGTSISLTSSQASILGLPTSTTVGDYLDRVNDLLAGKNGVIPSSLFQVINDVSDKINNLNHV